MKIVDGNKACSNIAYLFSEVCAIYPITPSSPMAENIDYLTHTDLKNIFNYKPEVVEMESEMGAAGALHGAVMTGSLATTFTASQGLLLMIPNMYKIAGERWPAVMHVAARSIATHALSIIGDHQDIYAARQTGWCMLASTNVEDAQNLAAVAHLSAIKASLPFMHFFDGFRTSHELNTIKPLLDTSILPLVDNEALDSFKKRALNLNNKVQYGTSQTEDIYFQCTEARNLAYENASDIVNEYMEKINEITGKDYKPFNYYGSDNAEYVIVAMGSVCDTIKRVIDNEKQKGNENIGLIEVHLYRPFSVKYLLNVLPQSVKAIAVLDRTKEAGSIGEPLYLDILSALKNKNIKIIGGRYGLSSKDTTPAQIISVYDNLMHNQLDNFTIGINDDLTNLSLPIYNYNVKLNCQEFKIYGFGSDGMVSASKDLLNLVNKSLGYYVQGYFEYDSKKSGGVTISHLRLSQEEIKAPYYVGSPSMIVITKDEYFKKFDMLSDAEYGAYVLVNTIKNEQEFNDFLPNETKRLIKEKHLNVNIINAEKIAYTNNLKGKINKIMEVNILKLLEIDKAEEMVIESIKEVFANKGQDVVNNNINACKEALGSITKVNLTTFNIPTLEIKKDIFTMMEERKGNLLSTKDVLPIANGVLPGGLSKNEKRNISNITAKWDMEKCIQCGMCTIVCPHAVIRNFITKDKTEGKPLNTNPDYNFVVGISNLDCTGCGLCANICPSKAITMEENVKPTDKLFNSKNDEITNKFTMKGAALCPVNFEFSGACAGCGETPYIRLLTSLFGDKIVIANATGCSSIYGGSSPCSPYLIPWANSLFEDNCEFAYGMHVSFKQKQKQILNVIEHAKDVLDGKTKDLLEEYLTNPYDDKKANEIYENLDKLERVPNEINTLKEYIKPRTVWAIGGDGWAYDIGYNGIDHVLHSNENVKILVLDTEVYSNTGGQASKSTKIGAVAEFADFGKRTSKKDLFKIASSIDNVYVATISLGANMMHTIKVFKEAMEHNGPALIIAYSPCIEHGIKKGMSHSINEEKLAVECGYTILMRSNNGEITVDSPEPDFNKYEEFLDGEVRFNALKIKDPSLAEKLLNNQKENAIKRYNYYKNLKN